MNLVNEHTILEKKYKKFFSIYGYSELKPVKITSGIDKSVYLVNSATNLFKSYFNSTNTCVYAIQPSMRTQILGNYYLKEEETEYPSSFESYGAYVSLEHFSKLVFDTINLFDYLGFERNKMRVRAPADDEFLVGHILSSALSSLLIRDVNINKYNHVYGGSFTGRAIKIDYYQEWQCKYKNLCYIILILENNVPIGAELATSDQLILMRLFNRQYAISMAKIADLLKTDTFEQRRFADSVVGVSNLIFEGIRPNSSNTNGRTFKKYMKAISYFSNVLSISIEERINIIHDYICQEYGVKINQDIILKYYWQSL